VFDEHCTIAVVARELGVNEQTLGNWVRQERIDRHAPRALSESTT